METQRDYHGESRTYLKELRARFEGQPEKLDSFLRGMKDVMALTDDISGRIEKVPDDVLARVKEILGGQCDLIHGFDLFLPPSHRFSLDDEDETIEVEEEAEDKDMEKAAAVSTEKTMLSQNFIDQQTMSGGKVWDDHVKVLRQVKDGSDLYKVIVPLRGDDTDLPEGFSRFMRDSEAISGASLVPNSQDNVNNGQEVIVQAGEQQQKQPEKIDQIGVEKDEDRNLVKRAVRDAEKGCDRAVIKKLRKDGLCLFDKVRKRLSCDNTYYKFLKVIFYYTNRKIRKPEWKERIAVLIGRHPDLMDEFQRYVTDSENVQVFRKKDGEEDEGQKIETRGRKKRDKKKRKNLNKSNLDLHLYRRKRCTPSYLHLRKHYRDPPKHNRMQPELQELNDRVLSVPSSGTEAFFSRKIDKDEEILFECEDNRYEMDMLIGWFSRAVEYADELEKGIPCDEFRKWNRDMIFLRCLERLYGDQGLDFLQIFNEDPQLALPVLRVRLEQKLKELKDYQDELREKWRCVYAIKSSINHQVA